MPRPLRLLMVEDAPDDAALVLRALRRAGYAPDHVLTETREGLRAQLAEGGWDLVLSDFSLPHFDGLAALRICSELAPDVPFILVSGAVGEDVAVEVMKAGAQDYVLKSGLGRLGVAVENALETVRLRRDAQQMAERRREAEALFRALFDSSMELIYLHDLDYRILDANDRLLDLVGYRREDLGTLDLESLLYDPREAPTIRDSGHRVLLTGEDGGLQERALRASDGRLVWIEVTRTQVVRDGRPFGILGVGRDITERKAAIDALLDSERRFRTITESSADAIFLTDHEGNYTYANKTATRLLGYSADELTLMSIRDVSPSDQGERNVEQFRELLATGRLYTETDLVARDGTVIPVDLNCVVLPDGQVYGSCRDLSERKMMQASLAQADRLSSMGLLAAGVAHEINNPLSYILYNLESLCTELPGLFDTLARYRERVQSELGADVVAEIEGETAAVLDPDGLDEMRQGLDDAYQGTRHIREVTRGLATFSRIESSLPEPVDIVPVIQTALSMVCNEVKYRARVVTELDQLPAVWASEGKLCQVFLNLLVNAAHAIDEGDVEHQEIRIRARQEGTLVLVEVQDSGSGIAAEHLDRLFEPFFTTKEVGMGSGLGLSISRGIVEGFGGTIEVRSELGRGSCFSVSLPVCFEEELRAVEVVPAIEPATRGRFLLVDDEPRIGTVLQRLLAGKHDTVYAPSGMRAMEILEEDKDFDGIVCDLMMPEVTGMDLHAWLKERNPDLARHMVFITGGVFTPKATAFLEQVGNPWFHKPLDPHLLTASLATLAPKAE